MHAGTTEALARTQEWGWGVWKKSGRMRSEESEQGVSPSQGGRLVVTGRGERQKHQEDSPLESLTL